MAPKMACSKIGGSFNILMKIFSTFLAVQSSLSYTTTCLSLSVALKNSFPQGLLKVRANHLITKSPIPRSIAFLECSKYVGEKGSDFDDNASPSNGKRQQSFHLSLFKTLWKKLSKTKKQRRESPYFISDNPFWALGALIICIWLFYDVSYRFWLYVLY
mmetsp:Transcript_17071/g.22549  ORF Transcript_17071/g.22549 Transcript_17071/m.22549 type:complete len:159 (-) Transcript_17071:111-587(-)